uniref:Uncharacterized protein n=1 Tax=Globodera rostochiensis TaxID=31243 RepID=A0A914HJZ6_GLORO
MTVNGKVAQSNSDEFDQSVRLTGTLSHCDCLGGPFSSTRGLLSSAIGTRSPSSSSSSRITSLQCKK